VLNSQVNIVNIKDNKYWTAVGWSKETIGNSLLSPRCSCFNSTLKYRSVKV